MVDSRICGWEAPVNQSMWALRVHERGGPEQLAYEQAPRPYVGIGDALVRVHAASFTPTELTWPSTWVDHAGHDRRPTIPAHEVSGVVEALGYGTVGVTVGQPVYGLTDWYRDGAAADYVGRSPQPRAETDFAEPCGSCRRPAGRPDGLAGAVRLWRPGRRSECAHPRRGRWCGRLRRPARTGRRRRGHRHRPGMGTGARRRTGRRQLRRRRT